MAELHLIPLQQPTVEMRQRLMLSANMQQALKLLQLSIQDLDQYLEEQTLSNPVLELDKDEAPGDSSNEESKEPFNEDLVISEHDFDILKQLDQDWQDFFSQSEAPPIKRTSEEEKLKSFLDSSIQSIESLSDYLIKQAYDTFESIEQRETAEILVGYIDEGGFLKTPFSEIASLHNLKEEILQEVVKEFQTFEPFGICASTIQDSLLIQLRCLGKEESLAFKIIANHYEELLKNQIPLIQKKTGAHLDEIKHAIDHDIAKLTLHPGSSFSSGKTSYIVPEVSIRQEGEQLVVETNREHIHGLRFNRTYMRMLDNPETSNETKTFIKHNILSAKWLMRNLQQRYSLIERIAESLAIKQRDFFINPTGKLVPLIMKTLAEELNVHESTITRTVSNKYINTPRGLLPLKSFFTTGYVSESGEDLSATTVKDALFEIIEKEDKKHPLSDEKISALLKEKGINCARRTVAKYRSAFNFGTALQRRQF